MNNKVIDPMFLEILACPVCKTEVKLKNNEFLICKKCGIKFPIIDGIPIMTPPSLSDDLKLTQKMWNEEYTRFYRLEKIDLEKDLELRDAYTHVKKYLKPFNNLIICCSWKQVVDLLSFHVCWPKKEYK